MSDNHMRHRSVESIKHSMGHLGTTPTSVKAEVFKSVTHGALDMFKKMTKVFGGSVADEKDEMHRLKQASGADDLYADLPESFSWRNEMPECLGEIED